MAEAIGWCRNSERTLESGALGEKMESDNREVWHETPNWSMDRCGPSGCGRMGALCLLHISKPDSRRSDRVESRPLESANRARRFSSSLRHVSLLSSSCQCSYVWTDRSHRGNRAPEATSRIARQPDCGCGFDRERSNDRIAQAWPLGANQRSKLARTLVIDSELESLVLQR